MRARIRYDRDCGLWQVIQFGRVIYETLDEDDAREYAACL